MLYPHGICSAMAANAAAVQACKERLQLVPEWDLGEPCSVLSYSAVLGTGMSCLYFLVTKLRISNHLHGMF